MKPELIEKGIRLVLQGLGQNLYDPNYIDTPERYARAMAEMFNGNEGDWATFEEDYTDFILLRGHKMFSLCPHHLLPVRFTVSLAYVPSKHVLGLSKLPRLLQECNNGPLLQEAFTKAAIEKVKAVCPGVVGAACFVRGVHGCMEMRGVRSEAEFVTYRLDGVFNTDPNLEKRFFQMVRM